MKFFTKLLFWVILSVCFLFTGCGSAPVDSQPVSETGLYFDTVITLTLYPDRENSISHLEDVLDTCFQMADTYENMLSRTKENSDVWNMNHADGAATTISDDTLTLLQTALSYAKLSDGKVDPSIGVVSEEWDFSADSKKIPPEDSLILEKLSHVNYKNIQIQGNEVTLTDPEMVLDLGFIAKGFIADQMKSYLQSEGINSAIINLGGNVLTLGSKTDGSDFKVGIQKPFSAQGESLCAVSTRDASVVSSGCYERYFEYGGKQYHHILNTATGFPIENDLLEVTILSDSSMDGDALSTTCYCLGLEDGMALINSLPDIEAIFVTRDDNLHYSSGLSENNLTFYGGKDS
ncbi:MAG: FAD:protein FMN transferase [Lachnospiraceae bacterium]|nr:FAD:protein FMN transferase [Lachnospiraceae bacterium]